MKKLAAVITSLVSCLLVFSGTSSADLISNGDFEYPVITAYYQNVGAGDPALTGWTVGGTSIDIVRMGYDGKPWAYSGLQAVDMAGSPGPGSISQSIATNPGTTYQLSFFVSSNADQGSGFANSLRVYWNDVLQQSYSSPIPGTWNNYTLFLLATSTPSVLKFDTDISSLSNPNQGPLLDNVSLNAVPIPPSVWLLGSSLIGLVALRRRFRK